MLKEVEYTSHRISEKGLQPTTEKLRVIVDAPQPKNVTQLKSFLKMLNYYGKFYQISQHNWPTVQLAENELTMVLECWAEKCF